MSYLALSITFDALYLLIALVQIGLCIHLLRRSTHLKSTTYLLLVASLCYVVTWSMSVPVDIVFDKLTSPNPAELFAGVDDIQSLLVQTLSLEFALSFLSAVGFALVSISILCAIAAAEERKGKALFWVGVGCAVIPAALEITRVGYPFGVELAISHGSRTQTHKNIIRDAEIALGLRIASIVFQSIFLAVLGKVAIPFKGHKPLSIVPKVAFPALILRLVLIIVNLVVINVADVPDVSSTAFYIVASAAEPLVVGCLLRVAYIWNAEENRPSQSKQGSSTSVPLIKEP